MTEHLYNAFLIGGASAGFVSLVILIVVRLAMLADNAPIEYPDDEELK